MTTPNIIDIDPITQKRWDVWCDARIKQFLETCRFTIDDGLETEINQLRAEVAELRNQVKELRQ